MLPFPRVVFAAPSRKATSPSRERVKTATKSSAAQEINRPLRTGTGAFAAFDYPLAFKRKEVADFCKIQLRLNRVSWSLGAGEGARGEEEWRVDLHSEAKTHTKGKNKETWPIGGDKTSTLP